MPYVRRTRRFKKPARKTPAYKKRAYRRVPKSSFTKRVMSVVNKNADKKQTPVQTFLNLNVGQFRAIGGASFVEGYQFLPLTAPGAGTGDSARIGNKIHLTGAQIRAQFQQMDATNTLNGQKVRIIVFMYKGPINTGIVDLSLLLNPDPMYTVTSFLSDRNADYFKDFKIICDKKYTMPQKQTASGVAVLDVKLNLKLNHDQHFNGTSTTSIADSQMIMAVLTDSGNSAGSISYIGTTPYFPQKLQNTGLVFNAQCIQYYTDV